MCNIDIKKVIKQHRLEAGLTMKELADLVGVSEATVSRWESGNIATMKHSQISKLCKALGINPASLVPGIDTPSPAYYLDPETAEMAEELHKRKDMRMLFHAAKSSTPEDVKMVTDMLERFKNS